MSKGVENADVTCVDTSIICTVAKDWVTCYLQSR